MSKRKKWLLIDCNYLCYRALYSTGFLTHKGLSTGVSFGFLKEIGRLREEFETDKLAFAFDSRKSLRKKILPSYKANRKKKEEKEEDKMMWKEFHRQVTELRKILLPKMGFENIFCISGFEADDIIASICQTKSSKQEMVIISADHDLYQCLAAGVSMYDMNRRKMLDFDWFLSEFGIYPDQWPDVKAFAGCSSDNIKGIRGVGEKTAIKWVKGGINEPDKLFEKFLDFSDQFVVNKELVRLPYKGTPEIKLKKQTEPITWKGVRKMLGAPSMGRDKESNTKRKTRKIGGSRYG